jgi:hypothetical protein
MKKGISFLVFVFMMVFAFAQTEPRAVDSVIELPGKVTVIKDARLDVLAKTQAAAAASGNDDVKKNYGPRAAKGYRLMVLSSNDRDQAMKVRSQLLQRYPEQKVYMAFQAPYIKLKFGNFVDKSEADRYKKMIKQAGIVTTNVYLVPEIVEVKPSKEDDKEKDKEKDKKK